MLKPFAFKLFLGIPKILTVKNPNQTKINPK